MSYILIVIVLLTGCGVQEEPIYQSDEFNQCLAEVSRNGGDAWAARCTTCVDAAQNSADKCYSIKHQ
jgi:hypothetical protein